MKLTIPLKPLSVNKCWQGRRFKTKDYLQYEKDLANLVRISVPENHSEYVVFYVFKLHNYALTDVANMEKPLTDFLTKRGYLRDDRYIKFLGSVKIKSARDEIELYIEPFTKYGVDRLFSEINRVIHSQLV